MLNDYEQNQGKQYIFIKNIRQPGFHLPLIIFPPPAPVTDLLFCQLYFFLFFRRNFPPPSLASSLQTTHQPSLYTPFSALRLWLCHRLPAFYGLCPAGLILRYLGGLEGGQGETVHPSVYLFYVLWFRLPCSGFSLFRFATEGFPLPAPSVVFH